MVFVQNVKDGFCSLFLVDKRGWLWLNCLNPLSKNDDGKQSFSNASESRCMVRTGAAGPDDLIPELIL